jgi:homocysteine S-methyltransferase
MQQLFQSGSVTLTEGSVLERVSRQVPALLDPSIGYAGMLDAQPGRQMLISIWKEYATAALPYPIVIHTPTWRCGHDRMAKARWPRSQPEENAVNLLRDAVPEAMIAGLLGPKGDCYVPSEAPAREDARNYHSWQVERLVEADCDFLLAATLPALGEALGIADAFAETNLAYVLSFVLRPDGCILDGTPLVEAIAEIDGRQKPPAGYWINCTHPEIFAAGMKEAREANATAAARVIGFQANTSPRDPSELDALTSLDTMRPEDFAASLAILQSEFGLRVLGGCCGTRAVHIRALAMALA